jgi:hypothetical protein
MRLLLAGVVLLLCVVEITENLLGVKLVWVSELKRIHRVDP